MKASIKFREDAPPLLRAKVPIGVLGVPFLSGAAAPAGGGDAREVRLDLATAFPAGPSLRLSYRPNDTQNPFSIVLKTGVGALGSPAGGSPLSMSAEFGLLGSRPTFSLLLKPRFGDFALKKAVAAAPAHAHAHAHAASSPAVEVKVAPVGDGHATEAPVVEFRPSNGIHGGRKLNGFPIDVSTLAAAGSRGGIDGILSGFEVSARTALPLRNRTTIQFKWGLRVPPELRTAFDDPTARISMSKLPLLVMNKISIERSMVDHNAKEKKQPITATEATDSSTLVSREVEALKTESGLLRRAVEELRAEIGGWKFTSAPSPVVSKRDHRSNGKPSGAMGKSEGLNDELLMTSIMSSTGAAI